MKKFITIYLMLLMFTVPFSCTESLDAVQDIAIVPSSHISAYFTTEPSGSLLDIVEYAKAYAHNDGKSRMRNLSSGDIIAQGIECNPMFIDLLSGTELTYQEYKDFIESIYYEFAIFDNGNLTEEQYEALPTIHEHKYIDTGDNPFAFRPFYTDINNDGVSNDIVIIRYDMGSFVISTIQIYAKTNEGYRQVLVDWNSWDMPHVITFNDDIFIASADFTKAFDDDNSEGHYYMLIYRFNENWIADAVAIRDGEIVNFDYGHLRWERFASGND